MAGHLTGDNLRAMAFNDSIRDDVESLLWRVATEIVLPRFRSLTEDESWEKSPGEIVTIVDGEAETVLERELARLSPSSRIVGEEAVALEPRRLDRLDYGTVWLVDPLDGTANFARGSSDFAIMVALLQDGEALASWMLAPVQGELAYAERGAGAYIDTERVWTNPEELPVGALSGALLTGFLPPALYELMRPGCARFAQVLPGMRCAGREYPAIARGGQHFALFWRTLPWDHAPGALFLAEAGGGVARLDGSAYRPAEAGSGLLLAHNISIWQSVHECLLGDIASEAVFGMTR
jgi:fructose-1,6-bisphosphatase/inositol monophosphatase family enzyme